MRGDNEEEEILMKRNLEEREVEGKHQRRKLVGGTRSDWRRGGEKER